MRKLAGGHPLTREGGRLGLEFYVTVAILQKGEREPPEIKENRDALQVFVCFASPLEYLRVYTSLITVFAGIHQIFCCYPGFQHLSPQQDSRCLLNNLSWACE